MTLKEENLKLKMELATIIMGYENELVRFEKEKMSDFSKGCMERYFELSKEIKEAKNEIGIN